jgi:regulator of protease activity HflC (stomatin/prohibitin superfamily)
MAYPSKSFWARYGARTIVYVTCLGLFVILVLAGAGSTTTVVNNTEVAIVVNNIKGEVTEMQNGGMVVHLPFDLTTVYKIDKSQRLLRLTRDQHSADHPEGEQINIKTNDGCNLDLDVELVYQIIPEQAFIAYRELIEQNREQNLDEILRAIVRSEVRSQFGELSTLEVAEALPRTAKLRVIQQQLAELFQPLGIDVVSVTAQNFQFDPEYEKIVRDRKEADQILVNQKDYQDAAREAGKRRIAEANRDKETALAQLQGELDKKTIAAQGEAARIKTTSEQQAYQLEREGETAARTADQEAAAILAEGQRKAEAMRTLFAAYESGGPGLVKEALVKLYNGVTIQVRPYSASERIEQLQAVPLLQRPSPASGGRP